MRLRTLNACWLLLIFLAVSPAGWAAPILTPVAASGPLYAHVPNGWANVLNQTFLANRGSGLLSESPALTGLGKNWNQFDNSDVRKTLAPLVAALSQMGQSEQSFIEADGPARIAMMLKAAPMATQLVEAEARSLMEQARNLDNSPEELQSAIEMMNQLSERSGYYSSFVSETLLAERDASWSRYADLRMNKIRRRLQGIAEAFETREKSVLDHGPNPAVAATDNIEALSPAQRAILARALKDEIQSRASPFQYSDQLILKLKDMTIKHAEEGLSHIAMQVFDEQLKRAGSPSEAKGIIEIIATVAQQTPFDALQRKALLSLDEYLRKGWDRAFRHDPLPDLESMTRIAEKSPSDENKNLALTLLRNHLQRFQTEQREAISAMIRRISDSVPQKTEPPSPY